MNDLAKILISIGLFLVVLGVLIWIFGGLFSWFGRLPGDIRIERENFRFYFPITSMLVLSFLLSLILNILIRIFRK